MLKLAVAVVTFTVAAASPAAVVVVVAVAAPPAKLAPINCGIEKLTTIPATGLSFSSVTFTTVSELARPLAVRRNLLASSPLVNLYFMAG